MNGASSSGGRRRRMRQWPAIDRASAQDLMQLAAQTREAPWQMGAVIVTEPSGLIADVVWDALGKRVAGVPRLRQRLMFPPRGGGRPVWVDDAGFDIRRHVREEASPEPVSREALLAVTARIVSVPLPADRPLWSATLVTGPDATAAGLILVFHHVMADGIGGLAALAQLVDGAPPPPAGQFPRAAPSRRVLRQDAFLTRLRAVAGLPARVRGLRGAAQELSGDRAGRPPRCSLNQPTGGRRSLVTASADLAAIRSAAHRCGGTVNDALLSAIGGALGAVLNGRGETVDRIVVSVPISARRSATATSLGNDVGAIPVAVSTGGDSVERLQRTARQTRARPAAPRGASAALLAPAFRILARLRLLRWFIDRQRLVTTFVTNVRGPAQPLTFLGTPITDLVAVPGITGNITVAFGALSYAGHLTVTVIADPDHCPDLPQIARAVQRELDALTAAAIEPSDSADQETPAAR